MINFLYCFDQNYNFQAFSSIISLLDKVDEKIHIFIIHKTEKSKDFMPTKILEHKNLGRADVYLFDRKNSNFPNLLNSHVSEATYYRLFCQNYIPHSIKTLFYIDADIICVKNPLPEIRSDTQRLIKSKKIISVKTEVVKSPKSTEVFERLSMINSKYFNAGVMNINYKEWVNLNIDFSNKLIELNSKLQFWDQDLLNNIFDGDYQELDERLNKVIDLAYYEYEKNDIDLKSTIGNNIFIHFAGSHKPWSVNGIMCNLSEIYHNEFRKITNSTYHVTHKIRSLSIYNLIKNILNFKFFRLKFKIKFIFNLMASLFKVKIQHKN